MTETHLCECGCGLAAPLSRDNDASRGYVKGKPLRFRRGHNNRGKHCGAHPRHGHAVGGKVTSEYAAYSEAKRRCTNPKHDAWSRYGGRGIKFLFENFEAFFAYLGPKPSSEHSLDRNNNDGNYEPGNVQWATKSHQNKNRRPFSEEFRQRVSTGMKRARKAHNWSTKRLAA